MSYPRIMRIRFPSRLLPRAFSRNEMARKNTHDDQTKRTEEEKNPFSQYAAVALYHQSCLADKYFELMQDAQKAREKKRQKYFLQFPRHNKQLSKCARNGSGKDGLIYYNIAISTP